MERTIVDIIRDAEVAYKTWCERLELLDNDLDILTTDEKAIVREAFTQKYEKLRAAAIKELEQKYSNTPIAEINSENEIAIEDMRVFLYNYCGERECNECVMNDTDCDIHRMNNDKVAFYYNMIKEEQKYER